MHFNYFQGFFSVHRFIADLLKSQKSTLDGYREAEDCCRTDRKAIDQSFSHGDEKGYQYLGYIH